MKKKTKLTILLVIGMAVIIGGTVTPAALLLPEETPGVFFSIPIVLMIMGLALLWGVFITKKVFSFSTWRESWAYFKTH